MAKPERILVVEDEPDLLDLLALQLESAGFTACRARDGAEGLRRAREGRPDLILSDIIMPVMNGYEFYHAVHQDLDLRTIPFIFLTTKGSREDIRLGKELGADDYLVKPVEKADLLISIRSKLNRIRELQIPLREDPIEFRQNLAPPEPPRAQLQAFSLGRCRAVVQEAEIAKWSTQKTKELLFYLLEAPRRRDEIIEALWEGEELKTATASVHSTVHRLRKAIAPIAVPYEDGWYRLDTENPWLDAREFDRLADQGLVTGQIQDLEAVVALYGGQYLEEFYSTWCSRRREDLEARYTEMLAKLSEIYAQRGDWEKTVRSAKGALDRDPYREELHRRVMEAYWAQGNRVAAVRHYQGYAKLLAEELGVEPLPETVELYQQILQS